MKCNQSCPGIELVIAVSISCDDNHYTTGTSSRNYKIYSKIYRKIYRKIYSKIYRNILFCCSTSLKASVGDMAIGIQPSDPNFPFLQIPAEQQSEHESRLCSWIPRCGKSCTSKHSSNAYWMFTEKNLWLWTVRCWVMHFIDFSDITRSTQLSTCKIKSFPIISPVQIRPMKKESGAQNFSDNEAVIATLKKVVHFYEGSM